MFVAIAVIAWLWPRPGGVLLIPPAFSLAEWDGISYGHMPNHIKLFVLATMALPPLAGGLILLWSGPDTTRGESSHVPE
jgi:hypothetical protein